MEGSGRGIILALYRDLPGGTDESHKNLSQDSRSPSRDLNPGVITEGRNSGPVQILSYLFTGGTEESQENDMVAVLWIKNRKRNFPNTK
jgi:hypothetical protein